MGYEVVGVRCEVGGIRYGVVGIRYVGEVVGLIQDQGTLCEQWTDKPKKNGKHRTFGIWKNGQDC